MMQVVGMYFLLLLQLQIIEKQQNSEVIVTVSMTLTHWGLNNMSDTLQMPHSHIFIERIFLFRLWFHKSLFQNLSCKYCLQNVGHFS